MWWTVNIHITKIVYINLSIMSWIQIDDSKWNDAFYKTESTNQIEEHDQSIGGPEPPEINVHHFDGFLFCNRRICSGESALWFGFNQLPNWFLLGSAQNTRAWIIQLYINQLEKVLVLCFHGDATHKYKTGGKMLNCDNH